MKNTVHIFFLSRSSKQAPSVSGLFCFDLPRSVMSARFVFSVLIFFGMHGRFLGFYYWLKKQSTLFLAFFTQAQIRFLSGFRLICAKYFGLLLAFCAGVRVRFLPDFRQIHLTRQSPKSEGVFGVDWCRK